MIKYYLATADRLNAKQWHNVQMTWEEILKRCQQVKITPETAEQYKAMPKDKKTKLKDVGGFVGGYLTNGKRSRQNVEFRSLITLDLDNATPSSWDDFTTSYNYTCLCYSTHSHTEEHPRLRLVFPVSRNMKPDEYQAVARYVAKIVGIEQMDKTTYDLERLFFWPSMPKDEPFYFRHQEGEVLDVDYVLTHEYHNWEDPSEWPTSPDEEAVSLPANKLPQDPTTKTGTIGAFCRCYNIVGAIETFLSTIYVPGTKGRYTYAPGTTTNGLIISKDGNFAKSYHGTDPACNGHLLNAFDLVRIHLCSDKDPVLNGDEDPTGLPSYKKMIVFAEEEEQTKQLILKERRESFKDDFEGIEDAEIDEDFNWEAKLEKKGKQILSNPYNVMLILDNHPDFKGKIHHDDFSDEICVVGGLPWDKEVTLWRNIDSTKLRNTLSKNYGIKGKEIIRDALDDVAQSHRIHPIRDYLRPLKWDGVPRLDTMLVDYLGAENSELNRAMTRKHMVAAVARVFQPGCKYDHCLVLAGPQAVGKSTTIQILASEEWFSDSIISMEGKDGMDALGGSWMIEMPELVSQKRSSVETVKAFMSKKRDKFRAAYAEKKENKPRQCVFWGTTNEDKFLKGDTGNRRFWIVHTPGLKINGQDVPFADTAVRLEENRDQLWAEAVHYFKEGEKLYLPPQLEVLARKRQEEYNDQSDDDIISALDVFLETKIPKKWEYLTRQQRREYYAEAGVAIPDGELSLQPVGTEIRKTMCAREFIEEFLDPKYFDTKNVYLSRKINTLMRNKKNWVEVGTRMVGAQYGKQKIFRRKLEFSTLKSQNIRQSDENDNTDFL